MSRNTIDTIMERRSIRNYRPDPIPEEHIEQILEAGRQAPSAGNRQPWHFVVVRDPELRKKTAQACHGQTWMADAALIVAAIGRPEISEKWHLIDPAIALQTMILAAHSLGYGTCWVGSFDEAEVKEVLGIPEELKVVCLTPVGVPDVSPEARPRKPQEEIFSFDTFGKQGDPCDRPVATETGGKP
ncbi:MAG: nitroreductase family protein [Candidatus Latescibacteria bacterium]|nr:nitroreductase family protein [Candidatus Latescibacterota bacterium]OPX25791.1 MAG: hypothetical protein B1H02_00565 [Candidatus Latescibacteria bacterium 4484_107]